MQYGGGRSILEFLMNATRFTMFGALVTSLLMVPACDDKKAEGKADAKPTAKPTSEKDAKDAKGGDAEAKKADP